MNHTMNTQPFEEDWEKEFDRRTNSDNYEIGKDTNGGSYALNEQDDHLFDCTNYPESPYELDAEKIKQFIRPIIHRTRTEVERKGYEKGVTDAIFVAKDADPQYGKSVGATYWGRTLHEGLFNLLTHLGEDSKIV